MWNLTPTANAFEHASTLVFAFSKSFEKVESITNLSIRELTETFSWVILQKCIKNFVQIWTRLTASWSSQRTSFLLSGCWSEHSRPPWTHLARADESGRLTGDRKVVFGPSARIRVKFLASQLYQAPSFFPYELSLELKAMASTVHSRPHLRADTALVIKLISIPVIFELCGREISASRQPPALFPSDPEATISSLCSSLKPLSGSLKWLA